MYLGYITTVAYFIQCRLQTLRQGGGVVGGGGGNGGGSGGGSKPDPKLRGGVSDPWAPPLDLLRINKSSEYYYVTLTFRSKSQGYWFALMQTFSLDTMNKNTS